MPMQTAITHSLLDEDGFLAELGSLGAGPMSKRKSPGPAGHRIDDSVDTAFDWPARAPGRRIDPVEDEVLTTKPSVLWRVTAALMFVLLMGVGAAGAAAVFHERVARIVAVWQAQ